MKNYNIQNYIRYKEDLKTSICNLEGKFYDEHTRNELIIRFMPLAENLARKFPTSQQAIGVMSINDLIQEGNLGLIKAVDKLNWEMLHESPDIEKTLKSFLSKRIKGAIRRSIDINRGSVKIPENKLIQIRKNPDDDKMVSLFFNSIFSSYDETYGDEEHMVFEIEDTSKPYNINMLNTYLLSLMREHLNQKQYDVLRLFYGLDCDKLLTRDIAEYIGLTVPSAAVRVVQIKKEAIDHLIANTDPTQVIDYL
jgi:RNA polymerase sigma factor (sigma-70 family)